MLQHVLGEHAPDTARSAKLLGTASSRLTTAMQVVQRPCRWGDDDAEALFQPGFHTGGRRGACGTGYASVLADREDLLDRGLHVRVRRVATQPHGHRQITGS